MTSTVHARKRSFILLYFRIPTHWSRTVLRIIPISTNTSMKHRCNHPSSNDGYRVPRIRPTLWANVTLRSNRNYKPNVGYPLNWSRHRDNSMRRFQRKQRYTKPIFLTSLCTTVRTSCSSCNAPTGTTRTRIIKPIGSKRKRWPTSIPPILCIQGPCYSTSSTTNHHDRSSIHA